MKKVIRIASLLAIWCASVNVQASIATAMFQAGDAMQVIVPVGKANAEDVRADYYKRALPLARSYGFSTVARLKVDRTLQGEMPAPVIVIGKWQDAERWQAFQNAPQWPELKALRAKGWEQLELYTKPLDASLSLSFDPDKFYTLAFASFNQENPNDYFSYLKNIEPALQQAGGKFIFKMVQPVHDTHSASSTPIGQITLVEWDTREGLPNLLAMPEYKKHSHLLSSGVSGFAFLRVSALPDE